MPPSATPTLRVEALDLLRLVAVLSVVLYHFGFWGPASHGVPQVALPWLTPIAKYGFLGVPAFFVISGFVIAYSAEGRTATGFAIARFSRIYPTFVFCMTLTFLAIASTGFGKLTRRPGGHHRGWGVFLRIRRRWQAGDAGDAERARGGLV